MASVFRKGKEKAKATSDRRFASVHKFLDAKRDSFERVKDLKGLLEDIDSCEKKRVIEKHHIEIFCAFHELFLTAEIALSRGSKAGVYQLEHALWALEQILHYLPELLSRRWQYHCLLLIFRKLLHPSNSPGLRKFSLRFFVVWYQILGVGSYSTEDLDPIFAALIPDWLNGSSLLERLCESVSLDGGQVASRCQVTPMKPHAVYRSGLLGMGSSRETAENSSSGSVLHPERSVALLIEKIFEYVSREFSFVLWSENCELQQERYFKFLFDRVKLYYIPRLIAQPYALDIYSLNTHQPESLPSLQDTTADATLDGRRLTEAAKLFRDTGRNSFIRWIISYAAKDHLKSARDGGTLKASSQEMSNTVGGGTNSAVGMQAGSAQSTNVSLVHSARTMQSHGFPPNFETVRSVLFHTRANTNLVLSVLRDGLLLPPRFLGTMLKVVRVLKEWINQDDLPIFATDAAELARDHSGTRAGFQATLQAVIHISSTSFFNPYLYHIKDLSHAGSAAEITDLFKRVLNLYRLMVIGCEMDSHTWVYLLSALQHIAQEYLIAGPPSDNQEGNCITSGLASPLLQTLLVSWVRGNLNINVESSRWDSLHVLLHKLTSWPQLADEWSKIMESLTRALSCVLYGVDLYNPPLEKASEGQKMRRQRSRAQTSTVPDGIGSTPEDNFDSGIEVPLRQRKGMSVPGRPFSQQPSLDSALQNNSVYNKMTRKSMDNLSVSTAASDGRGREKIPNATQNLSLDVPEYEQQTSDTSAFSPATESNLSQQLSDASSSAGITFDSGSIGGFEDESSEGYRARCNSQPEMVSIERASSIFDRDSMTPSPTNAEEEFSSAPEDSASASGAGTYISAYVGTGVSPLQLEAGDATIRRESFCRRGPAVSNVGISTGWQPNSAVMLWRRTLCILGNVNEIKPIDVHEQVFKHISSIVSMLLWIRENQGASVDGTPAPGLYPTFVPPIDFVTPWLFECLNKLPFNEYAQSQRLALACLCKIIIRRRDSPLSNDLMTAFLFTLHSALTTWPRENVDTILEACGHNLFSVGPPSLRLLFKCLLNLCNEQIRELKENNDKATKFKAVQLMASTAGGYCGLFLEKCTQISKDGQIITTSAQDLRESLFSCLATGASSLYPSVQKMAVRGLSLSMYRILLRDKMEPKPIANKKAIAVDSSEDWPSVLNTLLYHLAEDKGDVGVSIAICETLMPLLELVEFLIFTHGRLVVKLLELYCTVLSNFLQRLDQDEHGRQSEEDLSYVSCLIILSITEWSLRLPLEFLDHKTDSDRTLLACILETLCQCANSPGLTGGISGTDSTLTSSSVENPSNSSAQMCAQLALSQICWFAGQWPVSDFASQCPSGESGSRDSNLVCFSANDGYSLVTVEPLRLHGPRDADPIVRVFIRGLAGKLCFDYKFVPGKRIAQLELNTLNVNLVKIASDRSYLPLIGSDARQWLQDLVERVLKESPEVADAVNVRTVYRNECELQALVEKSLKAEQLHCSPKTLTAEQHCERAETCRFTSGAAAGNLLISELGLTRMRQNEEMVVLQRSDQLARELKLLDSQAPCKESHKMAIVYVGRGQEDKQSILSNQTASPLFESFCGGIGWTVSLETHTGYMGGLPAGPGQSLFYASPLLEIMFHVSTLICSDDITKKMRHIGNDAVHIVWSEHWRDYRRSIIPTDFCDILIVIYPIDSGLFRIQVETKAEVGEIHFGPLFDGAIVDSYSLPLLVRATAVNGSRALRRSLTGYTPFWETRAQRLLESRTFLSQTMPYRDYLKHTFLSFTPEKSSSVHQEEESTV